ncbi:DnaB-like helicase C-terminal domain-containing protein [Bacillus andreraoultii]|uniref:DnaB-like helicase C-terminal domain-containing protein n=1 Tax=Bacillus andreraoultii TaxID=1499685 RepID=UPI00053A059A|nr:DnaB-like helicase C-terminal domain-containing protein [Bacillus andreraoultii]
MIEEQLLSKMLDENNVHSVLKYSVKAEDFERNGDVFDFIVDYRKKFGSCPDIETVAAEFPDFDYMAGVQEPFKGLVTRLKQSAAKRRSFELIATKAKDKFKSLSGDEFVSWIKNEFTRIERETSTDFSQGVDFATNGQERRKRYEESKEKHSEQYVDLPYGGLQCEIGDYLLIMAYTNRGKSWLSSHIGLYVWKTQNKSVIYYSPELSQKQQQSRFETLDGHFNNALLRRGELENEEEYYEYLKQYDLTDEERPKLLIKTMEDLPNGLSLDVIEADLEQNPDVQIVVIDGFNLMNHGKMNDRNSMTTTSRRLRQLFARHNVLGVVTHQVNTQAEKENKEMDEETGARIVKAPPIESYSESVALIQDPAMVLTFDQNDGIGQLLVAKAREPIVGKTIDLLCNFNLGYIEEPQLTDFF